MKKLVSTSVFLLTIFALTIATSTTANAQVKTGAKGGISFTNFYGGDSNTDSRTGFKAGGFVKMSFPESPLAIQPEIYYAQKGAESGNSGIKLEYIEVPILFKLELANSGVAKPNVFLGPYAAMSLKSQQSGGLFGGTSEDPEDIDFGGVMGAGIDFEAGQSVFTIDLRYSFGLTPVYSSGDAKNSAISIVAGISLPSGDKDED